MDPLKFTYQLGTRVDDAIIYLLHRLLLHLESPGHTVMVSFWFFLCIYTVYEPPRLCVWWGALQRGGSMRVGACSLNLHSVHIRLYIQQDQTAIVRCVSEWNKEEYRKVIQNFADWCELKNLHPNTRETKEPVKTHAFRKIPGPDQNTNRGSFSWKATVQP